jgi:hypothetical protein
MNARDGPVWLCSSPARPIRPLLRFSRGAGLPEPLPDVLGVAIRLPDAHGPGRQGVAGSCARSSQGDRDLPDRRLPVVDESGSEAAHGLVTGRGLAAPEGSRCAGVHQRRAGGGRPRSGHPTRRSVGGWRARRARRASGRDNDRRSPWPRPPGDAGRPPARHQAQRTMSSRGSSMRRLAARSKASARDAGSAADTLAGRARHRVVEYVDCGC